jgi:hypothetical protein
MTVAPARADMAANKASTSEVTRTPLPAATITPKAGAGTRQARRCGLMLQSLADHILHLAVLLPLLALLGPDRLS